MNRYVASNRPEEPRNVADIDIRDSWSEDNDENLLMFHDNHNNHNRIIVFASERCMRHLAICSDLFV